MKNYKRTVTLLIIFYSLALILLCYLIYLLTDQIDVILELEAILGKDSETINNKHYGIHY